MGAARRLRGLRRFVCRLSPRRSPAVGYAAERRGWAPWAASARSCVLTNAQVQRYARQILVAQIGRAGQERFLESRVVIAGQGMAQETAAEFLAAAGVGIDRTSTGSAAVGELRLASGAYAHVGSACEACLVAFLAGQPPAHPDEVPALASAV